MIDMDVHVIEPPSLFPGVGAAPQEESLAQNEYLEHFDRNGISEGLLLPTKALYKMPFTPTNAIRYREWIGDAYPSFRLIKVPMIDLGWYKEETDLFLSRTHPGVVVAQPRFMPNPGTLSVLVDRNISLVLHTVANRIWSQDLVVDHIQHAPFLFMQWFLDWFSKGIFEHFPTLRIAILESDGWWVGPWLKRIEQHTNSKEVLEIFKRQVWVGMSTRIHAADTVAYLGTQNFIVGTDFPHFDQQSVDMIDEKARRILDANARRFLGWSETKQSLS